MQVRINKTNKTNLFFRYDVEWYGKQHHSFMNEDWNWFNSYFFLFFAKRAARRLARMTTEEITKGKTILQLGDEEKK
jgi:hypothetical protein